MVFCKTCCISHKWHSLHCISVSSPQCLSALHTSLPHAGTYDYDVYFERLSDVGVNYARLWLTDSSWDDLAVQIGMANFSLPNSWYVHVYAVYLNTVYKFTCKHRRITRNLHLHGTIIIHDSYIYRVWPIHNGTLCNTPHNISCL